MTKILDIMMEEGLLKRDEFRRIISAGEGLEPSHRVAIRTGLVSEDDFLNLVSREMGPPIIEALPKDYDPTPFESISTMFMEEHVVFPLGLSGGTLTVAVNDPFDHLALDTLKKLYNVVAIDLVLAREEHIRAWINQVFLQEGAEEEGEAEDELFIDLEDVEQLRDLASEAPVIKKVNQLMTKAVEMGASDIHFESFTDRVLVRFRVDGILREAEELPKQIQQAVSTRVKIMAKLDIAERRLPQDGRIYIKIAGKSIDLRVSILPTSYGESMVMRILDRTSISFSLESLGFPEKGLEQFGELIVQPHGILLVTGPTGSGKTTTLYSALNTINAPDKKIITIEDPVEYDLDGINQVHVNAKAGLTFAKGLRSIVRQDPDVILVGEIRDRETADIAVQSALTGHLVFSTLHTNDAAGAVTRLVEIGVEDYLLSSSLLGIMAQRLVRVLCPECKKPYVPDDVFVRRVGMPFTPTPEEPIYEPGGCKLCQGSGFKGRTAIYELLMITDEVRTMILENKSSTAIRDLAIAQGMRLLRLDGFDKVKKGVTSVTEVLRVAGHSYTEAVEA
jgi:type II secretion system protein E